MSTNYVIRGNPQVTFIYSASGSNQPVGVIVSTPIRYLK